MCGACKCRVYPLLCNYRQGAGSNRPSEPGSLGTCAYAGRSRQVYNHYPYYYYRTSVLINLLNELVFEWAALSGLWRFCGFFKKHLTELVFYKAYKIELVFPCSVEPPRAGPYATFSWKWGIRPHTPNFPKNQIPKSVYELVFYCYKISNWCSVKITKKEPAAYATSSKKLGGSFKMRCPQTYLRFWTRVTS